MSSIAGIQLGEVSSSRLSVPSRGRVLSTVAELYGKPIRSAVRLLASGISNQTSLPANVQIDPEATWSPIIIHRASNEMAAWHICSQWTLGIAVGAIATSSNIAAALEWFDSRNPFLEILRQLDPRVLDRAQQLLEEVAEPVALADLLPYILDPHGPGSRLSVRRDPSTTSVRAIRRAHGVFYTPADVAEHMAEAVLMDSDQEPGSLRILDPACGTGVFLRAVLRKLVAYGRDPERVVQKHLFGMDIDPWAVDAASYVIVHDALSFAPQLSERPSLLWSSVRRNLVLGDALSIDPPNGAAGPMLFNVPGPMARFSVEEVFPAMGGSPNVIIGNPPYAGLNSRYDSGELSSVFQTFPIRGTVSGDVHPLFFEQMIRLAAPKASGAMVLPLSIAFSTGQQFQAARQLIERTAGTWHFSFFDREPHALFGEDIKTRNTIITWHRRATDLISRKMTGPLIKWRGHDRARMLRNICHTEIHSSITSGIPKINSREQADALELLVSQRARIGHLVSEFYSTTIEQTFGADKTTLFVGGTAYNFISVFFSPPEHLRPRGGLMSMNTVHGLRCSTLKDAFAAFALLSSGVAFWLWHALGDGFHVSRSFLESLPLGPTLFNRDSVRELSLLGRSLWRDLKSHPVSSLNRGRASLSFPASRLRSQQRAIDEVILRSSGLSDSFLYELDRFIDSVVSATPHNNTAKYAIREELA